MSTPTKEGFMSNRWRLARVLVLACVVAGLGALGVAGGATARSAKCGSITFDENAWAGATANVYVVKYVLEKNFGCKINIVKLPESTPLFQAMTDGKVDVVLEDWGNFHLKINTHFATKEKSIIDLGPSGVIGHIGWYIPTYLMKQHPEFKTWKGLK
jgi:glycine betaine/proline transport system substrate-binding protein